MFGLEFVTSRLRVQSYYSLFSRVLEAFFEISARRWVAVPSEEWPLINTGRGFDDVRIVKGNVSRYLCLRRRRKTLVHTIRTEPPLN